MANLLCKLVELHLENVGEDNPEYSYLDEERSEDKGDDDDDDLEEPLGNDDDQPD